MNIKLSDIKIDAGTQVRAAISEAVVSEYAERMGEGVQFPPIVVFHDGNVYYLGDGFHRVMASQRIGLLDVPSDVRAGTKADALWFALGANKANAHRMTDADKRHAIELAIRTWPQRMQREIADQVGCHQSFVSRVSANMTSHTQRIPTGRELKRIERIESVKHLVASGESAHGIAEKLGISRSRVSEIRVELGLSDSVGKRKSDIADRRERMREMATQGHTSRQIAGALGLSDEGCRRTLRSEGIDVPADRAVGITKRHDSTRIVEHIVMDAENLTADVNLVDFGDLNPQRFAEWLTSLKASRDKLGEFIRALMKEQQKHGEAA